MISNKNADAENAMEMLGITQPWRERVPKFVDALPVPLPQPCGKSPTIAVLRRDISLVQTFRYSSFIHSILHLSHF